MLNRKYFIVAVLFLLAIGISLYQLLSAPKTGYVIITEVYNGFEFKKETEKKFLETQNARKKILENLALELNILGKQIEEEKGEDREAVRQYNAKREEYFHKKQTFEEDDAELSRQYDQEILTQLNQYMKDYGLENNYTYIYGNEGNGSLMYAEEERNITKPVIEYINNKYKGVK